jgi:hypothetical protein
MRDPKKHRAYNLRKRLKRIARGKNRDWEKANPEAQRRIKKKAQLKRLHGLALEEYERLLVVQNGVCAICRRPETQTNRKGGVLSLAVDHCHATDRIRGLLCARCNRMLGLAKDNPQTMRVAADYLERTSMQNGLGNS